MADLDHVDAEILRLLVERDYEPHELVGVSQMRKGRVTAGEIQWRMSNLSRGGLVKNEWDQSTDRPFYRVTREGKNASAEYEAGGRGMTHPAVFWFFIAIVLGFSVILAQRGIMGESWLKSAGTIAIQALIILMAVHGPGKAR